MFRHLHLALVAVAALALSACGDRVASPGTSPPTDLPSTAPGTAIAIGGIKGVILAQDAFTAMLDSTTPLIRAGVFDSRLAELQAIKDDTQRLIEGARAVAAAGGDVSAMIQQIFNARRSVALLIARTGPTP